jgi:hypothetical protein
MALVAFPMELPASLSTPLAQPPAGAPVVGSLLAALAISILFWPIVAYASTVVHEGGHAWTASMMGGRTEWIKIERAPARGETRVVGGTEFGNFVVALSGYLGPSVFGLLGALLLARGRVTAVLWVSVILLFAALLLAKTWFTRLVVVAIGALIVFVLKNTPASQQTFFAYTWVWLLLLAGFGHVIWHKSAAADYAALRRSTYVPVSIWYGFYWILTLAALVVGGGILFDEIHVW